MVKHAYNGPKKWLVMGIVLVALSARFVIPEDLFTSALAFDNIGLQRAFPNDSGWFGPGSPIEALRELQPVSVSAMGFTLVLFFIQIALGLEASNHTLWGKSDGEKIVTLMQFFRAWMRKRPISDFNWTRLSILFWYFVVVFFDTHFDASFKMSGAIGADMQMKAYVISFVTYSIGSELLLVKGIDYITQGINDMKKFLSTERAPAPVARRENSESRQSVINLPAVPNRNRNNRSR